MDKNIFFFDAHKIKNQAILLFSLAKKFSQKLKVVGVHNAFIITYNYIRKKMINANAVLLEDPKNFINKPYDLKIDCQIDIVIPIFNGYEYLQPLFQSIKENTDLPHTIFVVNDCSSDTRIKPFLWSYKEYFGERLVLIENEENLGFIKSVNKAFSMTTNHVALLNSDIVLPKNWASRLFTPMILSEKVASVTPFSNAATIFSLPNVGDNEFTSPLEKVNENLRKITMHPDVITLHTGVGFCMAMRKEAIAQIGFFDEMYGKGYSEENDWCMRAVKKGFVHALAANLFVWHKHGGSFDVEERQHLLSQNYLLLCKKYNNYEVLTNKLIDNSSFKSLRFIAELLYCNAAADETQIWFDHSWGGGAEKYTNYVFDLQKEKSFFIRIINSGEDKFFVYAFYNNYKGFMSIKNLNDLECLLLNLQVDKIVINNTAGYKDQLEFTTFLSIFKRKSNALIEFKLHDFQAICPTINMINDKGLYCYAEFDSCESCFQNNNYRLLNAHSIRIWQETWGNFLLQDCDSITVFSNSSFEILQAKYPLVVHKVLVVEHATPHLPQVNIPAHKEINIGVLGTISHVKGSEIVSQIADILKGNKQVNLKVIGIIDKKINTAVLGAYERENLPNIMQKEKIDIIFVPSIWPETYSYTTAEAMLMNMPVACFDIGAPAERVARYDKGLVIDKIEASYALEKIVHFVKELRSEV